MRYAREWADRSGDLAYPEAIRMLIVEEQRHATALARFMEMNDIPRIRHGFTDRIFRRMRNLFGSLEIAIGVLVTAEIVGKVYYLTLANATTSTVLRAMCDQIHREEIAHVEFQTQQLARLRIERSLPLLMVTHALHRILFNSTVVVVAVSHRTTLRRGGLSFRAFWLRCRHEFARDLRAMDPREHQSPNSAGSIESAFAK